MKTNLSVLDETAKGVGTHPVQTTLNVSADLQSQEGSPVVVRIPPCLKCRPIAALSKVDINRLLELPNLFNFFHMNPPVPCL